MESQPQNPEFRINPENFHPCKYIAPWYKDAPVCMYIPLMSHKPVSCELH